MCAVRISLTHSHTLTTHDSLSVQLCIVLNDMQHVRQWLCNLEEGLEFESFYKWLDTDGELNLGKRCKEMVDKLLRSADDDIYNRMSKIMAEITNKVNCECDTIFICMLNTFFF